MAKGTRDIRTSYRTVDRYYESRRFKTLAGARKYARKRMGENCDYGMSYAVDMYGTGRLRVTGATLTELFSKDEDPRDVDPEDDDFEDFEAFCREEARDAAQLEADKGAQFEDTGNNLAQIDQVDDLPF